MLVSVAKHRFAKQVETERSVARLNQEHGNPEVQVTYLSTNAEKKFHVEWDWTLQQVWDLAYEKLEEARKPKDLFKTEGGTDLTPYLAVTVRRAFEEKIARPFKFEIRSETGGA